MHIIIQKSVLYELLSRANDFVGEAGIARLDSIKIHADKHLTITASNGIMSAINQSFDVQIAKEGEVNVHGNSIEALVKELPDAPIDLEVKGAKLHIKSGESRYSLPTREEPLLTLPTLGEGWAHFDIEGRELSSILQLASIAAGEAFKADFNGNGVEISTEPKVDTINVSATDGKKLSTVCKNLDIELPSVKVFIPLEFISRTQKCLKNLKEKVTFWASDGGVAITGSNFTLFGPIFAQNLPNFKALLPPKTALSIAVQRNDLMSAMRRILAVGKQIRFRQCLFHIERETLDIRSKDQELAEGVETIKVEAEGPPRDFSINGKELLDYLGNCPEKSTVDILTHPGSTVGFTCAERPGWVFILESLRI